MSAIFLIGAAANAFEVPLPPPPQGGRNELRCERLTSTLLAPVPNGTWGGLPTYKPVKGGSVVHTCPTDIGRQIKLPVEPLRNYQLTLRWTVRDASGYVVSTELLPPFYLWGGVPTIGDPRPEAPALRLLAQIRRALWGA